MIAILCYGKRVLAPMHRTRRCRAAEIRFSNRDGIATLMRLVATVRGGAAAPNYTGAINNRTSPIAKGAAALPACAQRSASPENRFALA